MFHRKKMTDAEVLELLMQLPQWRYENGRLRREFVSGNFARGAQWITRIAEVAEALSRRSLVRP
jgi:pterin-4a-carbinolamine dehydratase